MDNAIEIKELKKNYGTTEVLKGIDLTVRKGEILALLGVNGAGKTTTLECVEGLRAYDSGTVTIYGKIAFVGTVDEFTAIGGNRHIIRIKTCDGQKEYETENVAETLIALLTDCLQKGIAVSEIQTDRVSHESILLILKRMKNLKNHICYMKH